MPKLAVGADCAVQLALTVTTLLPETELPPARPEAVMV